MQLDSDVQIQQAVLRELCWNNHIGGTKIGMAVEQGVVTLMGVVDSLTEKWFAQEAAHGVPGVFAVANDLRIRMGGSWCPTNTEVAQSARRALERQLPDIGKRLRLTVSAGKVTLAGAVDSWLEREKAEDAVRRVRGVHGIKNKVVVTPPQAHSAISGI